MNLRYLLDTNVISHIMQGRDTKLLTRLAKLQVGQAVISSVTLAEIEYGIQRSFEGSSLETIRQMVASGTGVTVLPTSCVPAKPGRDSLLAYVPISAPTPDRRVVLVYRRSFPRLAAISLLRRAVIDCALHGVQPLELPAY